MLPNVSPSYSVEPLTEEFAQAHAEVLAELADQIPMVEYAPDDILTMAKGDREFLAKWRHGLVAVEDGKPIAFIAGYERKAEPNDYYPENTLYISELAVAADHRKQGIARQLLSRFIAQNDETGFTEIEGDINYSVQTNSAGWNQHVIDLYESFGFMPRAHKKYDNRIDVVLGTD